MGPLMACLMAQAAPTGRGAPERSAQGQSLDALPTFCSSCKSGPPREASATVAGELLEFLAADRLVGTSARVGENPPSKRQKEDSYPHLTLHVPPSEIVPQNHVRAYPNPDCADIRLL